MGDFQWGDEFEELAWLPGGRLNMAHEAIDRHANSRLRDKVALIWEGRSGNRETYTFGQLKRLTNRFANVLMSLGIQRGDRVFTYMERVPELYVAFFGIMKAGAIASVLGTGPRIRQGQAERDRRQGARYPAGATSTYQRAHTRAMGPSAHRRGREGRPG